VATHDVTTLDLFIPESVEQKGRSIDYDTKYLLKDANDLPFWLDKIKNNSLMSFDYETTSMHPDPDAMLHHDKLRIAGFSMAFPDYSSIYIPLMAQDKFFSFNLIKPVLEAFLLDPEKKVCAHNWKFEYMCSRTIGITPRCHLIDTQILLWMLGLKLPGGGGLKLKSAVRAYLGHTMETLSEVLPGDTRAHSVPAARMAPYGADDSLQCLKLYEFLRPKMEELKLTKLFEELDCKFIPVLVHMQENGFLLDQEYLRELHSMFIDEMLPLEDSFVREFGISITATQQHSKSFFERLKIWPTTGFERSEKTRLYPADKHVRNKLKDMIPESSDEEKDVLGRKAIELIDRYSVLAKLESTYTLPMIDFANRFKDKRLRTSIHQTGTETGRISSTSPNLLNIPSRTEDGKKIRRAFIAEPGWKLVISDYSQSDLKFMAHETKDPELIRAYQNFEDIHQKTADICGITRTAAKEVNLGTIYCMSPEKLAKLLNIPLKEAKRINEDWHATYKNVKPFADKMIKKARDYGFIKDCVGRIRWIPNINSTDKYKRSSAERKSVNSMGQMATGDCIKIAMRNMYNHWKSTGDLYDYYEKTGSTKILLQIYDEIILEVKEEVAEQRATELKHFMETALKISVPLTTTPKIVDCWLDAK
jgi:DNA polymerase-1